MDKVFASVLLTVATVTLMFAVWSGVVFPLTKNMSNADVKALKIVTEYNATHYVCVVIKGVFRNIYVWNGTSWVLGTAYEGDLVLVPKAVAKLYDIGD